jgi:hypothetical protein
LQEDNAAIVGIFLTWIATGDIEDAVDLLDIVEKTSGNERNCRDLMEDRYDQLVQCFIRGDSLQSPAFQNKILESTILLEKEDSEDHGRLLGCAAESISKVYNNTPKSSPLRLFILDLFVSYIDVDLWIKDVPDDLLHPSLEFIKDLLHASLSTINSMMKNGGVVQKPWEKDRCHYHLHPGKPAGYKCT